MLHKCFLCLTNIFVRAVRDTLQSSAVSYQRSLKNGSVVKDRVLKIIFEGFPYHLEYLLPYLNIFVQCCQNIFFVDKHICEGCEERHSVAGPGLIKLADQRGLLLFPLLSLSSLL